MSEPLFRRILVAGATGFVGRSLVLALLDRGYEVRAGARHAHAGVPEGNLTHVHFDVLDAKTLPAALLGIDAAYYLVHSMGEGGNFRALDQRAASDFVAAAAAAGVRRIVYLGGVAPRARASEHLASRLEVGRILRAGRVPAVELRAAMIIGYGSASWQIVRDLALRLPVMVLPSWLDSRLSPIALEDAIRALVDALELPLSTSAYYDIPGPDTLTAKEILERIAALDGRRIPAISLPWLTPRLSALWLRIMTRTDYALARELVFGLTEDLLPEGRRFWELTNCWPKLSFDASARKALEDEQKHRQAPGRVGLLHEAFVRRLGPRLRAS
jgi:uncharacterized protein YbjT (DUF2867 family)